MKKKSSQNIEPAKGKRKKAHPISGNIKRIGAGILKAFLLVSFIMAISFFFLSVYYYLLESPYIKLEQIAIEGIDEKIRDELIRECDLHSGLSLVALNLYDLKQKIEKHPWIRSARLERRFPHTLILRAEKEVPWALVVTDRIYYMNHRGELFKEVDELDKLDFPVITGTSEDESEKREQLNRAAHVMNMLESENPPWSLDKLSEIHIRENESMSLYFNHIQAEIILTIEEFSSKIALRKVTGHLRQTDQIDNVNRIDLDYMNGAIVSFKRG